MNRNAPASKPTVNIADRQYTGKDMFQCLPGMFACQSHFIANDIWFVCNELIKSCDDEP